MPTRERLLLLHDILDHGRLPQLQPLLPFPLWKDVSGGDRAVVKKMDKGRRW